MVDAGAGMPRGLKIFGAIAAPLVVVLLAVLALGGAQGGEGGHGMGDHGGDHERGANHGGDHTSRNHNGSRGPVTWDVEVRDNSFEPAELTIQVGDTVRWTHVGSNGHSVTSDDDGEAFDSHPDCNPMVPLVNCMANGDDPFEYMFDSVGEIGYECKVHSSMTGTAIVVEQHNATPRHHGQ